MTTYPVPGPAVWPPVSGGGTTTKPPTSTFTSISTAPTTTTTKPPTCAVTQYGRCGGYVGHDLPIALTMKLIDLHFTAPDTLSALPAHPLGPARSATSITRSACNTRHLGLCVNRSYAP